MDSADTRAAASTTASKRRGGKKRRARRRRLHLRKATPTMQSEDKRGPKKIAAERGRNAAWPSSKKPPQEAQRGRRGAADSRHALRFACSRCEDGARHAPKDLVRHYEEKHRGSLPDFSCHMCTFSAHEFSYLQVHLLSHKDTFSSCSICDDDVQRTWSEFSAHLTTSHCRNGKYSCELCPKFSTGDVQVFLEHMHVQHFARQGANDMDLSLHAKDGNQFGSQTTFRNLRCQHCGYEATQKWLMAKHVTTNHTSHNGNQRKKKNKEEVRSIAVKPNDPLPKIKARLTRSAVREMCWLTQDCLALPGREFLDKYCHLSDPQTTLQETQQFLMKSVAGETGDEKWTKALKTVLSNVPPAEVNLHSRSENGIMSNSADLTVLTVKNKITVAQNGATYAKRLKMMAPSEKESLSLESAADDVRCVVDHNGCQSNLNDHTQTEAKLNNDASMSAPSEPSVCSVQENRENQELKTNQDNEEPAGTKNAHTNEDGLDISSEVKVTSESKVQTFPREAQPKNRSRRRKRKARSKNQDKGRSAVALKIVLKKNPVKEMQWVSQSSFLQSGSGGLTDPRTVTEGALTEAEQKKWTKASTTGRHEGQSKLGEGLTPAIENKVGNEPVEPKVPPSTDQENPHQAPRFLEAEVDGSCSAAGSFQSKVTELSPQDSQVQPPDGGSGCRVPAVDEATPQSSYTKSSPPKCKIISEDPSLSLEPGVGGIPDGEVPAESRPDLPRDTNMPTVQQEPSPASAPRWTPVPKSLERTLKLVAINPFQPVRRPARDQPVVVLNHPDADIPEVARIMEVVGRYRGAVQRVVLSRRTLSALSGTSGDGPADAERGGRNSVQERFVLKLKLRRLSRKKYEVVGAVAPSEDAATKFRCWFCGRAFTSQETWMVHRQRHLMEWNKSNCENS